MAKTDYGPEVKQAMDTPADRARDKARGIKEGSPQDEAIDAKLGPPRQAPMAKDSGPQPSQKAPPMPHPQAMQGAQQAAAGNPEGMARMAHAAGIAHAILGGRKMM